MKDKAKITQNFWQELQERGFLLDFYRQADYLAKVGDCLEHKMNGAYNLTSREGKAIVNFVSGQVFIEAVKQTEDIVKYKLFVNQ